MEQILSRATAQPATVDTEEVQPSPGATVTPDRDELTERVDTVAGSEFVDDRIRWQE